MDTNILVDYGWKKDDNVRHLFNTPATDGYDQMIGRFIEHVQYPVVLYVDIHTILSKHDLLNDMRNRW
jgi:hypothetical protein